MTGLLVALGLLPAPTPKLPMFHERGDFPTVVVCWEQVEACRQHRERLIVIRGIRGWEVGYWDDAIALTDQYIDYWTLLAVADPSALGTPMETVKRHLGHVRDLIGEERYKKRWSPPLMPTTRKSGAPRPNPNGANRGS